MINNPVLFYTASTLIVVFVLVTLFSKQIINSLLSSIIVFFASAIIFYILGSEYNAIIQAAIYGIAVPIIIGLSIMFTTGKSDIEKSSGLSFYILIFSVVFVILFIDTIIISNLKFPEIFNIMELPQNNYFEVMSAFAKGIFINYVWAFELVSVLLTIVIAGFIMISRTGYIHKNKGVGKWK